MFNKSTFISSEKFSQKIIFPNIETTKKKPNKLAFVKSWQNSVTRALYHQFNTFYAIGFSCSFLAIIHVCAPLPWNILWHLHMHRTSGGFHTMIYTWLYSTAIHPFTWPTRRVPSITWTIFTSYVHAQSTTTHIFSFISNNYILTSWE